VSRAAELTGFAARTTREVSPGDVNGITPARLAEAACRRRRRSDRAALRTGSLAL